MSCLLCKCFINQKYTHVSKWHTIIVYYKHDMSGRRKFAADIRDFQYSLYSTQERLYVKFSPDNPPLFLDKNCRRGGYLELIGLILADRPATGRRQKTYVDSQNVTDLAFGVSYDHQNFFLCTLGPNAYPTHMVCQSKLFS